MYMIVSFLNGVTWSHFAIFSLLFAAGWALWVYKDSILSIGRPPDGTKRIWQPTDQAVSMERNEPPPFVPDLESLDEQEDGLDDEDNEYAQMDKLIDEIETTIMEKKSNPELNSLLVALHEILSRYSSIAREPFQSAIHNYIAKLSYKELQLEVAPSDLEPLWG
jgi:hypothetical protein